MASDPQSDHSIVIEITVGRAAGVVWVVNDSAAVWRIFATGNSWGDEALSFAAQRADDLVRIVRAPQTYTRNVPSVLEIAGHDRRPLPFDLTDGTWDARIPIESLPSDASTVRAIFEIRESPEARTQRVWCGRLESAPVSMPASGS